MRGRALGAVSASLIQKLGLHIHTGEGVMGLGPSHREETREESHLTGKDAPSGGGGRSSFCQRDDEEVCQLLPKLREEMQHFPSAASFGEVCTIKFKHRVLAMPRGF